MKPCTCIADIDLKLEEMNLILNGYAFQCTGLLPVAFISMEWRDKNLAPKGKKNSPPKMWASHCPFCGLAYDDINSEEPTPLGKEGA